MLQRFVPLALVILQCAVVHAQRPPPSPPTHGVDVRAALLTDGSVARLVSTWGQTPEDTGATLRVEGHAPIVLKTGVYSVGTLATGRDALLVALAPSAPGNRFVVWIGRGLGAGFTLGDPIEIERPTQRSASPFAVAATATPGGFAVFFQEVEEADASAAHTYLVRMHVDGALAAPAVEVPVPWSLGAAIWNGRGFHLALFFPGDQRGMRLSMVSLSETGAPQQHPDWSSAAGFISDVHLERSGERLLATYRGGIGGERFFESDVTVIRGWGSEPPRARDRGAISGHQVIASGGTHEPRAVAANPN